MSELREKAASMLYELLDQRGVSWGFAADAVISLVLEEAAKVAERMPKLVAVSPDHVVANSPDRVAAAIRALATGSMNPHPLPETPLSD